MTNQSRSECAKHGEYEHFSVDHPFGPGRIVLSTLCPKCSAELNAEAERAEMAAKVADRVNRSGLPTLRAGYGFDSFPLDRIQGIDRERAKRAVNALSRWAGRVAAWRAAALAGNDARGLWTCLIGNVGTGKSGLAYSVALDACKLDMGVRYFTAQDLVRHVWDARHRGSYAEEAVHLLAHTELLIVDELGLKPLSETESAQLTEIFDGRYRNRGATLIVTNGTEADARRVLGERVSSRLDELGYFLSCDWQSLRNFRNGS